MKLYRPLLLVAALCSGCLSTGEDLTLRVNTELVHGPKVTFDPLERPIPNIPLPNDLALTPSDSGSSWPAARLLPSGSESDRPSACAVVVVNVTATAAAMMVCLVLLIIAGFRVALFWPCLAGNGGKLLTGTLRHNLYFHPWASAVRTQKNRSQVPAAVWGEVLEIKRSRRRETPASRRGC